MCFKWTTLSSRLSGKPDRSDQNWILYGCFYPCPGSRVILSTFRHRWLKRPSLWMYVVILPFLSLKKFPFQNEYIDSSSPPFYHQKFIFVIFKTDTDTNQRHTVKFIEIGFLQSRFIATIILIFPGYKFKMNGRRRDMKNKKCLSEFNGLDKTYTYSNTNYHLCIYNSVWEGTKINLSPFLKKNTLRE